MLPRNLNREREKDGKSYDYGEGTSVEGGG